MARQKLMALVDGNIDADSELPASFSPRLCGWIFAEKENRFRMGSGKGALSLERLPQFADGYGAARRRSFPRAGESVDAVGHDGVPAFEAHECGTNSTLQEGNAIFKLKMEKDHLRVEFFLFW